MKELTDEHTILNKIADILGIGSEARKNDSTILHCIENATRRSACLSRIERRYFTVPTPPGDDDDGEPGEECLLNWGDDPEAYEIRFGEALQSRAGHALNAAGQDVMRQTLEGIANANQSDWDKSMREDSTFKIWAQSRARYALAASPTSPAEQQPVEMSPEFTDTARAALLWVLWHHQGANSPVGQPIRFALGMGRDDHLMPHQIAEAKRWDAIKSAEQRGCKGKNCGCTDGVSHSEECLAEHAATIDQAVRPEQQDGQVCARCGGLVSDPVVAQIAEHGSGLRTQPAMKAFVEGCTFARAKVLATLRAKVEALPTAGYGVSPAYVVRSAVLAEIDKLGGRV